MTTCVITLAFWHIFTELLFNFAINVFLHFGFYCESWLPSHIWESYAAVCVWGCGVVLYHIYFLSGRRIRHGNKSQLLVSIFLFGFVFVSAGNGKTKNITLGIL